jgi:cation:H+ antiporter
MIKNLLILIIGFGLLIKGSDIFVEGTSSIAKKLKVPSLIIGLTIVAMGTSAPELSVSITSSLAGMNDMSIANVVGSNIFNLMVVLGGSALLGKVKLDNFKDVLMMFGSFILLGFLSMGGTICAVEGLVLLLVFICYIIHLILAAKKNNVDEDNNEKQLSIIKAIVFTIIGLVAIIFGGNFVVNSASAIALSLGMSENLVGLTIVALGTSLPELVTSMTATKKGDMGIAIGNVIGSNIFNVLLIIGTASSIQSLTVSTFAFIDIIIMNILTIVFILSMLKNKTVTVSKGLMFILLYTSYIIYTIFR